MILQIATVVALTFATGAVVGVTKLLQILATTAGARFATSSEAVAEEFLVTFGVSKAVFNVIAGALSDMVGRRICMLGGWLAGLLFAAAILFCKTWSAVVASDLLLGANQALCWSAALFIAHDTLGPARRGLASGLVETSGYAAIALASPLVSAVGLGGFMGMHIGLVVLCAGGAAISVGALRETRPMNLGRHQDGGRHCDCGSESRVERPSEGIASSRAVLEWPSGRREDVSAVRAAYAHATCIDSGLMACCLVGLCLNLSTAYAWGAMSRWLAAVRAAAPPDESGGLSVGSVLLLYSIPKGVLQLPAGRLADTRACCGAGAKGLVLFGLLLNALMLLCLAAVTACVQLELQAPAPPTGQGSTRGGAAGGGLGGTGMRATTAALLVAPLAFTLGAGTACAYSPIMACVASRAEPSWRACALGAYRFWRDLGYAVGAVLLGRSTDSAGSPWAAPLLAAAALLLAAAVFARSFPSGETHPAGRGTSANGLSAQDSAAAAAHVAQAEIALADMDAAGLGSPHAEQDQEPSEPLPFIGARAVRMGDAPTY